MTTPTTSNTIIPNDPLPRLFHIVAITFAIASPILILLPPRKLDLYTGSLAGAFCLSANYITQERTGKSILQHLDFNNDHFGSSPAFANIAGSTSERAREVQAELRRQREVGKEQQQRRTIGELGVNGQKDSQSQHMTTDGNAGMDGKDTYQSMTGISGMAKKVWMGEETEGWKKKRIQEEKEALEEGKGYADLIIDQIWEVWNWGRKDAPASPQAIREEQLGRRDESQ